MNQHWQSADLMLQGVQRHSDICMAALEYSGGLQSITGDDLSCTKTQLSAILKAG